MRRFLLLLCVLFAAGCSTASSAGGGDAACGASERTVAKSRCSMGFRELFFLAKGREWTQEEVKAFQALDQPGKNRAVRQLAAEAGCIRTEDQIGTDGVVYTAFWKE
jgi:hypothetical protein